MNNCKHEWSYEDLKEPNFGVTFAVIRICKKCKKKEGSNLAIGYHETPFINIEEE